MLCKQDTWTILPYLLEVEGWWKDKRTCDLSSTSSTSSLSRMEGTSHLVATEKCILIKAHIVKITVRRRHANYISKMSFFFKAASLLFVRVARSTFPLLFSFLNVRLHRLRGEWSANLAPAFFSAHERESFSLSTSISVSPFRTHDTRQFSRWCLTRVYLMRIDVDSLRILSDLPRYILGIVRITHVMLRRFTLSLYSILYTCEWL